MMQTTFTYVPCLDGFVLHVTSELVSCSPLTLYQPSAPRDDQSKHVAADWFNIAAGREAKAKVKLLPPGLIIAEHTSSRRLVVFEDGSKPIKPQVEKPMTCEHCHKAVTANSYKVHHGVKCWRAP